MITFRLKHHMLLLCFFQLIFTSHLLHAEEVAKKGNASLTYKKNENFRLLIPNFNYTTKQEDIHLLQFRKGNTQGSYNIMIDVAFNDQAKERLLPWLKTQGVSRIDEIYITHPHQDHYGGLWTLIDSNIYIGKIWMNMPDKEICDKEIPWGCDYSELVRLTTEVKKKGIALMPLILETTNTPKLIFQSQNNLLELLYASSPINQTLGPMDINDLSMIMKLNTNGTSYLFTGDLNVPLSKMLAINENNLRSNVFKASHHGTDGNATNEFIDKVQPEYALVPSPKHLWCSERSKRYRDYFSSHQIKTYVSGFHGDLVIRHSSDGTMDIQAEFPNAEVCK